MTKNYRMQISNVINLDKETNCPDTLSISLSGAGNGPIAAFVDALHTQSSTLIPRFEVIDYYEHSLSSGAEASAIAYIKIKISDGSTYWGAGVDTNMELASIKAILSAVNRALIYKT